MSDIHANVEALQATLGAISMDGVDRIVCAGDVVGYNANPAECIARLREVDPLWIAGNHDRAVAGRITMEGFGEVAARAIAWTRHQLSTETLDFLGNLPLRASIANCLVVVHGALHPETGCELVRLDNDERRLQSFKALMAHPSGVRVCAFGHTHHVGIYEFCEGVVQARTGDEVFLRHDAYYLVNPGTVGQPRTPERRATYLTFDTARQVLAIRRVHYDASLPRAKARRAGLLPRSSYVPPAVREPLKRGVRAVGLYDLMKRHGW